MKSFFKHLDKTFPIKFSKIIMKLIFKKIPMDFQLIEHQQKLLTRLASKKIILDAKIISTKDLPESNNIIIIRKPS